jgi:hypothetical protein
VSRDSDFRKHSALAAGLLRPAASGLGDPNTKGAKLYVVSQPDGEKRLIKATSKAQALRHATLGYFSAQLATAMQVAILLESGGTVEDATLTVEERVARAYTPPDTE